MGDLEDEDDETPKWLKIVMALVTLGIGILNVTFDWLWVSDMLNAETALVFGRPPDNIVITMIVMASFGNVVLIGEIVNMFTKLLCEKQILNENKAQVVSLFVEEVPTMTLNMLLAACRERPISTYQMVKAGVGLVSASWRTFRVLWMWITAKRKGLKTGLFPFLWRTTILTACLYCTLAAILAWSFTYTIPPDEDGSGLSPPPTTIQKGYNGLRYFYKAGIFYSHPTFNHCNNNSKMWEDNRYNWLQIKDLLNVTDNVQEQFHSKFTYNTNEAMFYVKFDDSEICYKTNLDNCSITEESLATCQRKDGLTVISIEYRNIERSKTLVFGDIKFQASIESNGSCNRLVSDEWGFLRSTEEDLSIHGQLQYMKTRAQIPDDVSNFVSENSVNRYFTYDEIGSDLYNVTEVWLTGYRSCDMTGALSPNNLDDADVCS